MSQEDIEAAVRLLSVRDSNERREITWRVPPAADGHLRYGRLRWWEGNLTRPPPTIITPI